MKKKLSHIDNSGKAHMVDIGGKPDSQRRAIAGGRVLISKDLLDQLRDNTLAKGDALTAARIAAIQAAKKTSDLIPLCHTLPLTHVSVKLSLIDDPPSVEIEVETRTCYKTGVEMEALTAAAVAALTIYDMGKAVDKGMIIESIRLLRKEGGRSGIWSKEDND
ncbi:MAG: cyclic pyranopterin monophosphate synthase MoaC [candidate division Zixibacteria bacterium]